jgi:hypothetical protein
MDWLEALGDINYWAVLVAVASSFAVGMAWYSESVFGKTWMKLSGISKKDTEDKEGMMNAMGMSAVASFFSVSVVAALMLATGTDGWADGAIFGAVVGFGIAMGSMVVHNSFSKVPKMLTKINGIHDVVRFAIFGAIIGGFGF